MRRRNGYKSRTIRSDILACTNYPDCKNIKSFKDIAQQNQEPEYTGEKCEKCGARTVFSNGKFGRFIGCERYPDCDFVKNITFGVSCPKCKEGDVVERKSKRNKLILWMFKISLIVIL